MGYAGKLDLKLHAQKLRKQGLSYREILQGISVSKDTLSRWCKDIELTVEQQKRLIENKQFGQRKGSIIAAENKRRDRVARTNIIREEAKQELGQVNQRERFITGIALYAGEGDKADRKGAFTNSDPLLIKFMMEWFKDFAMLPIEKFRGAIWIHENLDQEQAKRFWAELTGIPQNQFHKTYISSVKKESRKIRKNIHPYGVFSIRFSDSAIQRRILGWIYALFSDKMMDREIHSPVAQR